MLLGTPPFTGVPSDCKDLASINASDLAELSTLNKRKVELYVKMVSAFRSIIHDPIDLTDDKVASPPDEPKPMFCEDEVELDSPLGMTKLSPPIWYTSVDLFPKTPPPPPKRGEPVKKSFVLQGKHFKYKFT